jgi:hypothetical protein
MDESIRTAAISPLRQRLIDDMNTRRFSQRRSATTFRTWGALRHSSGVHPIQRRRTTCADFPALLRQASTLPEGPNDAYRSQKAAGPCGHLGNVLSVSTTFADN